MPRRLDYVRMETHNTRAIPRSGHGYQFLSFKCIFILQTSVCGGPLKIGCRRPLSAYLYVTEVILDGLGSAPNRIRGALHCIAWEEAGSQIVCNVRPPFSSQSAETYSGHILVESRSGQLRTNIAIEDNDLYKAPTPSASYKWTKKCKSIVTRAYLRQKGNAKDSNRVVGDGVEMGHNATSRVLQTDRETTNQANQYAQRQGNTTKHLLEIPTATKTRLDTDTAMENYTFLPSQWEGRSEASNY
ncbi:hypothetical protein EDC04DRAFT_2751988 [Pisolithus marmoratus]|nr:hypothetical protein EDC04DRAFT_2751988 [Pisolithus marmoratus]